jgi:CelD/BcsL family acetyltransferase involved in cellulose biosynthesis
MSEYWREQRYALRFQLSDLTLARMELPILTHACSLDEIRAGVRPDKPPSLPSHCRGFLIRSSPGPGPDPSIERQGDYIVYAMDSYERCFLSFDGTFADYQAKFSSKTRNSLNRKIRKFQQANGGMMRVARYATPHELLDFHVHARRVSAQTYQERLLDAGLPADDEFLRNMAGAAARNEVRAFLLFLRDRPVAYLYCPVESRTIIYAYLGFDPSVSELSPGTVLLWLSLQSLFEEAEFAHFDFTEGDSPQKRLFSTGRIPCHNAMFLRRDLRNELVVRAHHGMDELSRHAGRMLDRAGIKKRLKKMLRGPPRQGVIGESAE